MYSPVVKRWITSFQRGNTPESRNFFSENIRRELREVYRPQAYGFFEFYIQLREHLRPQNLVEKNPIALEPLFVSVTKQFVRARGKKDNQQLSSVLINQIISLVPALRRELLYIDSHWTDHVYIDGTFSPMLRSRIRRFLEKYALLVVEAAKDKGVYTKIGYIRSGRDPFQWPQFRKMSEREQAELRIRDEDPQAYKILIERRNRYKELESQTRIQIEESGMTMEVAQIFHKKRLIGVDPVTQERFIYDPLDPESNGLPLEEWKTKKLQEFEDKKKASKQNTKKGRTSSYSESAMLKEIDNLRWEGWESWKEKGFIGEIEFLSLSDDFDKSSRNTKVLPVSTIFGHQIVTEGRYEGVFVDSLINEYGRVLEGSHFAYDEKKGRPVRVTPGEGDPFISVGTLTETFEGKRRRVKKLYLIVNGTRAYASIRQRMTKLAQKVPSVSMFKDERLQGNSRRYYFDPKDYSVVKRIVRSFSMSQAATKLLQEYLSSRTKADRATQPENLEFFKAKELGGFRKTLRHPVKGEIEFEFLEPQQKAMAWLDAQENSGVCALGTGIGKTLTAVGVMQKLQRDGFEEDPSLNGRYLYVCPEALTANLNKEILVFMTPEDGKRMAEITDSISYSEFIRYAKSNQIPVSLRKQAFWKNKKRWDLQKYIALFFDEAQQLLYSRTGTPNLFGKKVQVAVEVQHPRKICLTASPMDIDPREAYMLSAICKNKSDLFAKNKNKRNLARKEMADFFDRFCNVVGGRVVGMADLDADESLDLDIWVKTNIFYGDKTRVVEDPLPSLETETKALTMPYLVEAIYRSLSRDMARYMRELKRMIETGKHKPGDTEYWKLTRSKFGTLLNMMKGLSLYPDKVLSEILSYYDLSDAETPVALKRPLRQLRQNIPKSLLIEESKRTVAPKIEEAVRLAHIRQRTDHNDKQVLFVEDPEAVILTAKSMSERIPGYHVAGTKRKIHFFMGGEEVTSVHYPIPEEVISKAFPVVVVFGGETLSREEEENRISSLKKRAQLPPYETQELPFTPRNYILYPSIPAKNPGNKTSDKTKWIKFVMDEIVQHPSIPVSTCTLEGKVFSTGQNLQKRFSSVIHLDRNTWSSEEMKQRTARVWRSGQTNAVQETILDSVYAPGERSDDATMDEIRKLYQEIGEDVFSRIIQDSQDTEISQEYYEIQRRHAAYYKGNENNVLFGIIPNIEGSSIHPADTENL